MFHTAAIPTFILDFYFHMTGYLRFTVWFSVVNRPHFAVLLFNTIGFDILAWLFCVVSMLHSDNIWQFGSNFNYCMLVEKHGFLRAVS